MRRSNGERSLARDITLGVIGGLIGTLAMRWYWSGVEKATGSDPRQQTRPGDHALDAISPLGTQHEEDESSTAAIGRLLYEKTHGGQPPDDDTKQTLSQAVHWSYGALQGGLYGASTGHDGKHWVADGTFWGTGMWALGDELLVPLLGLADGPGAYPLRQHVHRLGAHLAYGLALGATKRALETLIERIPAD